MVGARKEKQNRIPRLPKKKHSSQSLAVKTLSFTQNLSYLNPKGEDSSCQNDGFMNTYIPNLKWT